MNQSYKLLPLLLAAGCANKHVPQMPEYYLSYHSNARELADRVIAKDDNATEELATYAGPSTDPSNVSYHVMVFSNDEGLDKIMFSVYTPTINGEACKETFLDLAPFGRLGENDAYAAKGDCSEIYGKEFADKLIRYSNSSRKLGNDSFMFSLEHLPKTAHRHMESRYLENAGNALKDTYFDDAFQE